MESTNRITEDAMESAKYGLQMTQSENGRLKPTSLVPSPLPAAILQWPERWSGTFARYFDTALGALAKILASAFMSCDTQFSSFIRSPT